MSARSSRGPKAGTFIERLTALEERIEGLIAGLPDAIAVAVNNAVKDFISKREHENLKGEVDTLKGEVGALKIRLGNMESAARGAAATSSRWERWALAVAPYAAMGLFYAMQTGKIG
jgi:hypothetical protein